MTRAVPEAAKALVREFEGYRDFAYLCPAGVWTAGWGHTGPEVKQGVACTKQLATIWLAEDLKKAARRIELRIGAGIINELTENQWSALLSFVLNLGADPKWTVWKKLKARDFDAVPDQLLRFVNGGGKRLPGLVRRRAAEVALWHEGEAHDTPSSAELRITETPPASDEKPVAQSKTFWAGALVAAGGAVDGAKQVQALVAPQAEAAPLLGHLAQFVAVVIVAGGIAIMLFRYFDAKARRA
jgi:lysozyme